jgi:hypothetical protein
VEARQTLTGSAFPKALVVVLAVCATVALAAMGAAVSKGFGPAGSSVANVGHPAPGTVLRQDNPPVQGASLIDRAAEDQSQVAAPAATQAGHRGGVQFIDSDFGFTAGDGNGYQSDLTRVLPTETQGYNPGWDAKSVREGHGQ